MTMLATESNVMAKTRELCDTISQDAEFLALQEQVERFLSDEPAKLAYQAAHEQGEELGQKQQAGVALSDIEIKQFEEARQALIDNEVTREFMAAQESFHTLQKTITKYVGMTLELGRVPEAEDMQEGEKKEGCCGGGCGC